MRAGFRVVGRTLWGSLLVQAVIWGPVLGLLIFSEVILRRGGALPWPLSDWQTSLGVGIPLLGFLAITTTGITRWMSVRLRDPGARTNVTFAVTSRGALSVFLLQMLTVFVPLLGPPLLVAYLMPWGFSMEVPWVPLAVAGGVVLSLVLQSLCFMATPAVVVEDLGPLRAIRRSLELGRGRRADLFGLACALFLVSWLAAVIPPALLQETGSPVLMLLGPLSVAALLQLYLVACRVAAYYDLRAHLEGEDPERIAAIFD